MITQLRRQVAWPAIPIAGVAAGTAFLASQLLLSAVVLDTDPLFSLRYIAALVLGSNTLTDDFTIGTAIVGLGVHYLLSLLFTLVIAIVIHRWGLLVGVVGGAVLGLSLYLINLYTLTSFVEWFFAFNSTVLLVSHVIFGVVAGGVYESLDRFDQPFEEDIRHAASSL